MPSNKETKPNQTKPSLLLLSDLLCPRVGVLVRVRSIGQIDLLKIVSILLDYVQKKNCKEKTTKKCKYEYTMNMIPSPLGMK